MKVTGYKFKDHVNSGKSYGRNGIDTVHLLRVTEGIPNVWFKLCEKCKIEKYIKWHIGNDKILWTI